jgi:hypothetical protein
MIILAARSTSAPLRLAGSVGRMLLAGAKAFRTVLRRRRTYGSLAVLDDRMLHDIGLHRSMLLGVAIHGLSTAREAEPLATSASSEPRPSAGTWVLKVVSEVRERIAADDLRNLQTRLGPSQLKELSQDAFGPPADRFPFA